MSRDVNWAIFLLDIQLRAVRNPMRARLVGV